MLVHITSDASSILSQEKENHSLDEIDVVRPGPLFIGLLRLRQMVRKLRTGLTGRDSTRRTAASLDSKAKLLAILMKTDSPRRPPARAGGGRSDGTVTSAQSTEGRSEQGRGDPPKASEFRWDLLVEPGEKSKEMFQKGIHPGK